MRRLVVSDILKGLRKRKADNDEAAMNYKTVGLIGLCSGAGTTQLGIMLANYFSNGLHLKTAIVSAGFDDSFDRIKEEEQVGKVRNYAGSRRGFSYKGIDFFGGVREGFVHVISEYYDVVIVEINLAGLKEKLADGLRDVMSCECRILVGSMVPWKYGECIKRLGRIRRIYSVKNMPIVSVTWQEKRARSMEREFELRAYKAPMEENPFEMRGSDYVEAYEQLSGLDLKGNDQKLYKEVSTMAAVQEQYQAYLTLMGADKYDLALDALVRGIGRYDKGLDNAKKYGREGEMNHLKDQLEEALDQQFGMSTDDARKLYKIKDREEYSKEIQKIIQKMNLGQEEK